jgi:hypothetical protein
VDSAALLEALDKVYHANRILDEIRPKTAGSAPQRSKMQRSAAP